MRSSARNRVGAALVSVLWVVSMMAVAAAAAAADARRFTSASQSRAVLLARYWQLRGCLAEVRADLHEALRADESLDAAVRRVAEQRTARSLQGDPSCAVAFQPRDVSLPTQLQTEAALATYFDAYGFGSRSAELRDALMDWTDADSHPRPRGAERDWYLGMRRVGPRNAAVVSVAELRLVSGFELLPDSVLQGLIASDKRVSLNHAPQAVLAALPGVGAALAGRIAARRASGRPLASPLELEELALPQERDDLERAWTALVTVATAEPESWTIRLDAANPRGGGTARARIVLAGRRTHLLEWVPE